MMILSSPLCVCRAAVQLQRCQLGGVPMARSMQSPSPALPFPPPINCVSFCRFTTVEKKTCCAKPEEKWVQDILSVEKHKDSSQ